VKLSKAEKKQKAREERRLKSKMAKKGPAGKDFGSKMAQAAVRVGGKPAKPVFNAEGKMVFSKVRPHKNFYKILLGGFETSAQETINLCATIF
jgi:hypothetical protein